MFTPGPRNTPTAWSAASSAIAAPIFPSNSTSQLQAVVTAVGKQVAGRDSLTPRKSLRFSCLRRPWGPSHMNMDGISYWGKALVSQKFFPSHKEIFSLSVILVFISTLFYHPSAISSCSFSLTYPTDLSLLNEAREKLERFRILSANQQPDHWTISEFRRRHYKALDELLVQTVQMSDKAGLVKLEHISVDGTKIKANASKHSAMSYGYTLYVSKIRPSFQ